MKVVVIGGVAGGASTAARIRRLDESAEIIMFERGQHVSFSNCALPYHLGGDVPDSEDLIMMDPWTFRHWHNIDARTGHEVLAIHREEKTVEVRCLADGSILTESYDKLVLAPGAHPILPESIPGIHGDNVYTVRNVMDIQRLSARIGQSGSEKAAVVGGGFIGIELAENLQKAGCAVSVIEGLDQILAPFDEDMVQILHKELMDQGIDLHLATKVTAIAEDHILTEHKGQQEALPADLVVMAIGVAPETALAKKAGLAIGETGGICVNEHYQTSDPDIYAVGDAIESRNLLTGKPGRLALAGPAQRQARAAADHICGVPSCNRNQFIGSSCIRVFGQNAASTGLTEKACRNAGISCDSVLIFPGDKVGIMPDSHYMAFKLIFEVPSGRVLGAQAIGQGDVTRRVDVIATLILQKGTVDDVKELELCYSPVFGTAKDVTNLAGLVAGNLLDGTFRQVHVDQVRSLVESGACIIDVREEGEYENGHLRTSVNIPLSQLRERLSEIPRDVPVYLHCRSSQRSYYATKALMGHGFDNVFNISGSFLGISLYEYYRDKTEGREPIVTEYNFR